METNIQNIINSPKQHFCFEALLKLNAFVSLVFVKNETEGHINNSRIKAILDT
jgi:hypothetical protein